MYSRAGLPEWLAETSHKPSSCPSQVVAFQGGCSPLGRSRREQVQREEDCLPCQESGGPGGGTALGRRCWHLEGKFRNKIKIYITKAFVDVLNGVTI